jgi:hypothetical protein
MAEFHLKPVENLDLNESERVELLQEIVCNQSEMIAMYKEILRLSSESTKLITRARELGAKI